MANGPRSSLLAGDRCGWRAGRTILPAVVAFALALAGSARAAQAPTYRSAAYPVGGAASAIGYGDYNGDGIPDLIVALPADNAVVLMAGRADGTFAPPSAPIPVGQDPVAVTSCVPGPYLGLLTRRSLSADFNSDGKCDLAVADAGSTDIAVLIGNGDGTFKPATFIPVSGSPGAIVATQGTSSASSNPGAIAFLEPAENRLAVLRSRGDGTFYPEAAITVGADPVALVVGGANFAVADAGARDVRAIADFAIQAPFGHSEALTTEATWTLSSTPQALAAGSFGAAGLLAVTDSAGNLTLLGDTLGAHGTLVPTESAPIPVGPDPIAISPLRLPPASSYADDLAIVNGGAHQLTLLRQ
ncbi:MAG: VCBS repeat-containing protein, partial [Actinomycetota bacterium]|nr:VCBS repeat-containing protein [Actinomycetota bacterium]